MALTRAQRKQLQSTSDTANTQVSSISTPQTMKQETNTDTELRTLLHSYTSKNSAASNIQTSSAAELLQSESSLRTISEPVQRGLKRKRSSDSDSSSGSGNGIKRKRHSDSSSGSVIKRKRQNGSDSSSGSVIKRERHNESDIGSDSATDAEEHDLRSNSVKILRTSPASSRVPSDDTSTITASVTERTNFASSPQLPPSFVVARQNAKLLSDALKSCECGLCRYMCIRPELPQADDATDSLAMQTRFHTVFESATDPSTNRLKACESRLTVKSPQSDESAAKAKAKPSIICPLVTERLGDRLCPDIVLEHGQFKDAGVQEKALRNSEPIPELSLSVFLRERQQNSRDILSVKGRCILAAGLAAALLPFLETPFTRNAIHSSVVCFHAPAGDELPNLALPFLKVSKRALTSSAKGKNGCPANHRQPSIQEFGVLLMEIYYCQIAPREGERGDKYNCKTRWQVCVDRLPCFKAYAPRNYYLAAKACLEWEDGINDRGSFDGAEAQEYFYQAVVKRLESVIYKKWNLTLSDLVKIDASEQKDCWGPVARQAYTHFKSQTKHQKIHPEMGQ